MLIEIDGVGRCCVETRVSDCHRSNVGKNQRTSCQAAVGVSAMADVHVMRRTIQRSSWRGRVDGNVPRQFRYLRRRRVPVVHVRYNHFNREVAEAEHEHEGDAASNHERKMKEISCALNL